MISTICRFCLSWLPMDSQVRIWVHEGSQSLGKVWKIRLAFELYLWIHVQEISHRIEPLLFNFTVETWNAPETGDPDRDRRRRLLEALNINPTFFTFNEGHSAFCLSGKNPELMQKYKLTTNGYEAVYAAFPLPNTPRFQLERSVSYQADFRIIFLIYWKS